jgi:anti-sigma B factor antagonist
MRGEETEMAPRLAVARETTWDRAEYAEAMLAAAGFRVDVAQERDCVRICPVGEVDVATIGLLRAHIDEALEATCGRIVLDLRETTFLDSTLLHLAVEVDARASRDGTEFAIIAAPPAVQRTFHAAGLSSRLPFVDVPRG